MSILFVVGAGASKEVGLPIGSELTETIAKKIDIRFDDFGDRLISGEPEIVSALREHVKADDGRAGDINPYLHAGWLIRDAMPQAPSIDDFIDAHQGDERVNLCGKLAIVRSILEAEENSGLYFGDRDLPRKPDFSRVSETWYNRFMQILTDGCQKEQIVTRFESISFISFNYDRCIEHFLFHALQNYYGIEAGEAGEFMGALNIYHPYGLVGHMPWQDRQDATEFGAGISGMTLLRRSQQIKTYTEQIEDDAAISEMRLAVQKADTIVFLGFAFHKQNMTLIKPDKHCKVKSVYATALSISSSDCEVVRAQIVEFVGKLPEAAIYLENNLDCNALFNEYRRSLTI